MPKKREKKSSAKKEVTRKALKSAARRKSPAAKKPAQKKKAPAAEKKVAGRKSVKKEELKKRTGKSGVKRKPIRAGALKRARRVAAPAKKAAVALQPALPVREVPQLPRSRQTPPTEPQEIYIDRGLPLPESYGEDRITALVKDPNWIFVYWELTGPRKGEVERLYGRAVFEGAAWILRVHDCSSSSSTDIRIDVNAGNWYVPVGQDRRIRVEIGFVTREGRFIAIASSREVQTPRSSPSSDVSEEWMASEETFHKFLELSCPIGASGLSSAELAVRVKEAAARIRPPRT